MMLFNFVIRLVFRVNSACLLVSLLPCLAMAGTTSYHIGNSLTWDSQPLGIAAIANQHGFDHVAGYHIRCSWPLNAISADPEETCVDPVPEYGTFAPALANHAWDAVTMQPHPNAAFNTTLATDETAILEFINIAQTNPANVDTTFYIYAAWPRSGSYQSDWTQPVANADSTPTILAREYFTHLIERVRDATDAVVNMIPVGEVLYELDLRMRSGEVPGFTSIDQFYRDTLHLSWSFGRYTAAITTYATLFGKDPAGYTKPGGYYGDESDFTPELYAAIHDAVWEVVPTHPYTGAISPAGDFDHDGVVDGDDFVLWQSSYGINGNGDADGDEETDGNDFLLWQGNYGIDVSASASAQTLELVPEPSGLVLLLLVGLFVPFCQCPSGISWRR
jgi:uncharacterized protein DUF4886